MGCLIALIVLSALALISGVSEAYAITDDRCGAASEHQTGSVQPPQQDAASSQAILTDLECHWLYSMLTTIGRGVYNGMAQEHLIARLRPAEVIGEEKYNKALKLIESAYAYKGPIIDWQNLQYKPCHRDHPE
jgi:hypothetical protein